MNRFLREAEGLADPEVREVTKTLSEHARAFYKLVQKRGIANYASTIDSLIQFDVEMDRKYYQELEGTPQDMAQLVNHLNTVGVN